MICPVCNESMLILEYQQVELDYCPNCEGSWLDTGELEILLETPTKIIDLSDLPESTRSQLSCPRCRKKMRLALLPETEIELDVCPRDGGIWLDKGELREIAESQQSSDDLIQLRKLLNELFIEKNDQKET